MTGPLQGWERQAEGVWEWRVPGRMKDVANHEQVDGGGSGARKGLTAWQSASSKASPPGLELNEQDRMGGLEKVL